MIVAVVSIPILIHGLGKDRFGALVLAWALIGYASLFDMGLGRALTQLVAKKLGEGAEQEIPTLVWTSLLLMLARGIVGAAVIGAISPWLIHRALKIPAELQSEVRTPSIYLVCLLVVITTSANRGSSGAYQRFGIINALRIPMGVFAFAGPLLVLPFSKSLSVVMVVLVIGRVIAWGAHLLFCLKVTPSLSQGIVWRRAAVGPLLRFGSWMTVNYIVGPLMIVLSLFNWRDPFYWCCGRLHHAIRSCNKTLAHSIIITSSDVPRFLHNFCAGPQSYSDAIWANSEVSATYVVSGDLADRRARTGRPKDLAGERFRSTQHSRAPMAGRGGVPELSASAPFAVVQGAGIPDLTAKLHLIELPIYLGVCLR